jgi:hypothetical protein
MLLHSSPAAIALCTADAAGGEPWSWIAGGVRLVRHMLLPLQRLQVRLPCSSCIIKLAFGFDVAMMVSLSACF